MEALCRVMATGSTQMAPYKYSTSNMTASDKVNFPQPAIVIQAPTSEVTFAFLQLPLEIRLQIYEYLLPPRTHKIAPTFGFRLGPCLSTYPQFSKSISPIYRILNANVRPSYPNPTIHTELFRVCRQITSESEPLLYGSKGTLFDFGTSLEIIVPFFKERSALARNSVTSLKIAKEVSVKPDGTGDGCIGLDGTWTDFCISLPDLLPSITFIELTVWSASGTAHCFPSRMLDNSPGFPGPASPEPDAERQWKEWAWTKDLLRMENVREVRIKCWDFRGKEISVGQGGGSKQDFDSWLAARMVTDEGLRGRAIWNGSVIEGNFIVRCDDCWTVSCRS